MFTKKGIYTSVHDDKDRVTQGKMKEWIPDR